MSVTFHPVGQYVIENGRYFIALDPQYMPAALGLEAFGHIKVIWWFNLYDNEQTRHYFIAEKPYTHGPDRIGIFATRSPVRPNPIAVTTCALIQVDREKNRIEIAWTDAENGTPVLDIKPYEPSDDRVRDIRMPEWCKHWPEWLEESEAFDWSKEFNFPT